MDAQSGRARQVFKWLGLLVGGMMMLGGSFGALSAVVRLPFSGSGFLFALLSLGMSLLIAWLGWRLIVVTGTEMSFSMAMKIMLLIAGGMMLLGGGLCAITNAYFSITNGLGGYGVVSVVLMGVSILTAILGWVAIKYSGFKLPERKNTAEKTGNPTDAEGK